VGRFYKKEHLLLIYTIDNQFIVLTIICFNTPFRIFKKLQSRILVSKIKQSYRGFSNLLHRWREKKDPSERKEKNVCTLESMCLKHLEISSVMWSTKKLYHACLSSVHNKKRHKLKYYIDSTQEQKSSKILKVDIKSKERVLCFLSESIRKKSKKLLSCKIIYC